MGSIITAAIIKGGTGKTTTAAALAQAAKKKGRRVLAIDLDPQGNLSAFLEADTEQPGALELLGGADPAEVIQQTGQEIEIISSCPDLAAEKTAAGSVKRLEAALDPIKEEYDFIFIDTPPQMGELTYNALQASTGVIVPMEADNSSISGLYQLADIIESLQQRGAKGLSLIGAILTRYDARSKINAFMRETIIEALKEVGAPYLGEVRSGIAIREAQATRASLFQYAPKSKPAQDYMKIFEQIEGGI